MEPTVINTALAQALAAQYPSMQSLDLRSNNIVSIQDLQPLSGLRELALDDNRLGTLDGLAELQLLTSLSARSNLITELGGRITALSSLRVLDLAWNRLAAGPWLHQLANLPQLRELDLQGNPVCELEGSQQLLAAALPHLQRLNGAWLRPEQAASPQPQVQARAQAGSSAPGLEHSHADAESYRQQHLRHPGEQGAGGMASTGLGIGQAGEWLARGWPDPQTALGPLTASPRGDAGGGDDGTRATYQPTKDPTEGLRWAPNSTQRWSLRLRPTPQVQQARPQQDAPWPTGSTAGAWLPPEGPQLGAAGVTELRSQLEAADRAHSALAAVHAGLLGEHERLAQRTASLEDALRQAENANAGLQQQLQQQSTSSAQQAAGLAAQVAALLAERDAAVAEAEALAARLSNAEARGDDAARAAGRAAQMVEQLQAAKRQMQQELAATQKLLIRSSSSAKAASTAGAAGAGAGAGAGGGALAAPPPPAQAGSPGSSPGPRGGAIGGGGGSRLEVAALQQRVDALQQVVRMQERELVRLGGLAAGRPPGGAPGATDGAASSGTSESALGWDNVLRPWREQVLALQEHIARLAAEGAGQRSEWGQQLGEMREQFTQARTLLEVLEQRSREQRSENSQLQARISQLGSELQEERQRATGLEQQVAARDAAAQAVRRQLLAFKAHIEQREAALEARAEQLSAYAVRLSYASRRLAFALSLAAVHGGQGGGPGAAAGGAAPALVSGAGGSGAPGTQLHPHGRPGPGSHVALQGLLAASPAAKMAAASLGASAGAHSTGWTPWTPERGRGLGLGSLPDGWEAVGAGGGSAGVGAGGAAQPGEAPLVAVLRQELAQLGRERAMLLQRLAQVSSSAEERIRQAQAAMQEREARHCEALVAARVQVAQQAAEAEAERKMQAAEAAAAAQAARVRQQVAAALEAAEELCRHTEAAAGVGLSKMTVRLSDLAQQVRRLRAARQRAVDGLLDAGLELERLRAEVASARDSEAELRRQLARRNQEAHAQLAELRADQEEALAAERRRTAEAERLAAKASAECGQLELQLARTREVKAQQEDARLRRLQTQVHEQETQLRSLRRERNTLLAELRKQLGARAEGGDVVIERADTHAGTDTGTAAGGDKAGGGAVEWTSRVSAAPMTSLNTGANGAAVPVLVPQPVSQRGTGPSGVDMSAIGGGAGSSIRQILRSCGSLGGVAGCDRWPERDRDAAALRGSQVPSADAVGATVGQGGPAADPQAAVGMAVVAAEVPALEAQPNGSGIALQRLTELEALTAELLSLD